MSKKKGKKKKGRSKNNQNNHSSLIVFIALVILMTFGLYVYSQQRTPVSYCASTAYKQLDIPEMIIPRQEQLIQHIGYTVSYNKTWRLPNWVGYELTRQETQGKATRGNSFSADPQVDGTSARNSDYTRSQYDKGHMAPAADMKWNKTVMQESFYFTNVCPQRPELNRRRWKDLEDKIRDFAEADSVVIVVCGPIIDDDSQTLGKSKIVIPQRFFKVLLAPYCTHPKAIGFLFDNDRAVDPLRTYVVSVDSIETLTGMDFFGSLPDSIENKLEAVSEYTLWGL